jgi:flagellar basal-body rod protein FlgB
MLDKLNGTTFKVIEKALDGTSLRNEVIAQNMANVDTPGYKRKTVNFEKTLSAALEKTKIKGFTTDKRHIPVGRNNIEKIDIKVENDMSSLSVRLDENNVDIENEMAEMAKNNIKYNYLVESMNKILARIKNAINEGKG